MNIKEWMESIRGLGQDELVTALNRVCKGERRVQAAFIGHLAGFEERKVFRELGYGSSYQWMTVGLGMSEATANRRIQVARLISRCEDLAEPVLTGIVSGDLSLATLGMIASHVTPENGPRMLSDVARKPRLLVERYLAENIVDFRRLSAGNSSFRVVQLARVSQSEIPEVEPGQAGAAASPTGAEIDAERTENAHEPAAIGSGGLLSSPSAPWQPVEAPPQGSSIRLFVTLSGDGARDFLRLRELFPWQDLSQIMADAIGLLRKARDLPGSRLPRGIQRQVFARDGHRCTFVSDDGIRCPESGRLQIDHILPKAKGGSDAIENLRLLCAAHNQLMAERHFGREFIRARMEARRGGSDPDPDPDPRPVQTGSS
ncbi:HNH endonuclease [bacterium]|nr:HNH endonuclease [bacterium]